jgi:hypothetical protein
MSDYMYEFSTLNEIGMAYPIHSHTLLEPLMDEPWPQSDALVEDTENEVWKKNSTSKTHRELQEARDAEAEEEEEEDDDDEEEDEDDEDEDEEGEEGEGDEEEEEEDEVEPDRDDDSVYPEDNEPEIPLDDRFFLHNEKLRKKYNDVELDSFMKLLNITPTV